jgi:aromatic ring-opening dioxygenase LigB subunit
VKSGPYGFSKKARVYDEMVLNAVAKNQLRAIMRFKKHFVDAAKPDSIWQMAILAGITERIRLTAQVVSYDVPTYFGMICASFRRAV